MVAQLDIETEQDEQEATEASAMLVEAEARAALDVTVQQGALARALGVVKLGLAGRTTLPVLSNVLVEATAGLSGGALPDGTLRLTCTDLEHRISMTVPANVAHDGALTVPAALLSEYVQRIPSGPVAITGSAASLRVKAGKLATTLKGIDSEEFPPDAQPGEVTFTLPATTLRRMLDLTTFAVAKDESRPVLACVHLLLKPDAPILAESADGFRMAYWPDVAPAPEGITWDDKTPSLGLLIARESAKLLRKLLPKGEADVALEVTKNHGALRVTLPAGADASVGDVTLTLRLCEGQFPDLLRVIPRHPTATVKVFRETLRGALERAHLIASRATDVVKVTIKPDGLTVYGWAGEVGEHEEEIAANVDLGEDGAVQAISMNATYLLEALAPLPSGEITLGFQGALSPFLITDDALPGYVIVVMPMHTVS